MKDFLTHGNLRSWSAVAVFLVGIMAYAGANGRLTAAPQELLGVVLMPLQKVTSALSGGIGSVWEKYTSIDEVMEQNEQLEAENAELRQQMVDYDRIKAENEAYKALARIQDSNTEASYISAFVIGRDPLDEFGGFTLDCGTVNGAAVNDAVISDKGYLIGMVVEADTTSCKVMTILHPSFSAAGVVSRTRENGIINGSTDYAGDGLCVLTNLERATETKMGDQVITTGLGGCSRRICWWGPCRRWSRKSAANLPLQWCARVQTRARSSTYSLLPTIKGAHLYGITPHAQPQPDPEMGLLRGGTVCVRGTADDPRPAPAGAGKAAVHSAAVSGCGRV